MSEVAADARTLHLTQKSDAYWTVTLDIPPLNIFGPANIPKLGKIESALEGNGSVRMVVFDSVVPGSFLTHYEFVSRPEDSAKFPLGPTGLQALPDMLARLSLK
jgi:enoyl-CoA hydratase/carnithine racemase